MQAGEQAQLNLRSSQVRQLAWEQSGRGEPGVGDGAGEDVGEDGFVRRVGRKVRKESGWLEASVRSKVFRACKSSRCCQCVILQSWLADVAPRGTRSSPWHDDPLKVCRNSAPLFPFNRSTL